MERILNTIGLLINVQELKNKKLLFYYFKKNLLLEHMKLKLVKSCDKTAVLSMEDYRNLLEINYFEENSIS